MIEQETIQAAKAWCSTGVAWIEKNALNLGLSYLNKAIPVFEEIGDGAWLTYARHQRLEGLRKQGRHEQVEVGWEEVMDGYARLDDPYGKALLLVHVAESIAGLGRRERALVYLNLAGALAEAHGHTELHCHVLWQQAQLFLALGNVVKAVRLYGEAEAVADRHGAEPLAVQYRFNRAQALIELGERSEAAALLEDVQSRFRRQERHRDALEALALLGRLYQEMGQADEQQRVAGLIHASGQTLLGEENATRSERDRTPRIAPLKPAP
ncbi:MAG: hypothetical protein HY423_16690 [Candidatus Lambdaproteobacteria bacterium]|nr:hypothetical protein [Candidatus Lambdaproteobacteria bacterium]